MMRIVWGILFLVVLTGWSCSNATSDDCDPDAFCDTVPYDYGVVELKVSGNATTGVPIVIYRGYVEDQDTVLIDTVWAASIEYYLDIDERYAAEAFYQVGNQTIITLDGKKLNQDSYYNCDEKCYDEAKISLDLKKL